MLDLNDVFGNIGEQINGFYQAFNEERSEGGLSALLTPIDPFNRSDLLTPLVSIAGVVTMLLLSGVAVGAMAATLAALLALYFLLTQVFGYEISVAVPAGAVG